MVVCVCRESSILHVFIYLFVPLSACLFIYLSTVCLCLSFHPSIHPLVGLFIYLFLYLLTCLFISWLVDWLINWLTHSLIHWGCKLHTHCVVWNDGLCLIMSSKRCGRKWLWLLSISRQNLVATYLFLFWGIFVTIQVLWFFLLISCMLQ